MKMVTFSGLGTLPALGMGCMGMSEFYGPPQDETASLSVLGAAYEGGIRLFDTADFYGAGANERLLGRFLREADVPEAVIATKCGIKRGKEILPDGNFRREFDGSPEWITACAEASIKRLGLEVLDLFYLHRVDPKVAIEESAGAMARLIERGLIRSWGISEADAPTLRRAHDICPVTAVQSEYSLWFRNVEDEVLPLCHDLGIAFVAYAPLGRGIVPHRSDEGIAQPGFATGDFRLTLERAQPDVIARNAALYLLLDECGLELDMTPYQVMLAWVLGSDPQVMAIPGMRRQTSLRDNLDASRQVLPAKIRARLDSAFGRGRVHGGRYTVDPGVSETFAATS